MKKRLSIVLSLLMVFMLAATSFAKDKVYNDKITEAVTGYKNGSSTIFSSSVLGSAGQGAEWLAISAKRAGVDDNYSAYLSALKNHVETNLDTPEKRSAVNATDLHRIALAIDATGGNAENFNGINFISEGIYNRYTEDEGNKAGTLGKQGANAYVWGLIALDSKNHDVPADAFYTKEQIISSILSAQKSDGGFSFDSVSSDNDFTATTITALSPYYSKRSDVKTAVDKALTFLTKAQQADGDFKNSDFNSEEWGNYPGAPNSSTTAQVLTALSSLGIDCRVDSRFIKNGKTILDGLYKYQKSNGTFAFDTADLANPGFSFGNEQAFYSLVAYERFSNNKRNLFDFASEKGSSNLKIKVNGKIHELDFDKSELAYDLVIDGKVEEVSFVNIPLSPYETSKTDLNKPVQFENNKIVFEIAGRYKNTSYEINLSQKQQEESIGDEISKLPENLGDSDIDKVQKLLSDYEALSMQDRKNITNYSELQLKYLSYIQGKDLNYVTSGQTPEGNKYTITINGKDITNPVAFDTEILLQSENDEKIKKIHNDAFVIHFAHSGDLPGKTQIKLETGLSNDNFGLYYFNGESSNKIQDVLINDGVAEFNITHCSDYYLSKTAINSDEISAGNSAKTGDNGLITPIILMASSLFIIGLSIKKLRYSK